QRNTGWRAAGRPYSSTLGRPMGFGSNPHHPLGDDIAGEQQGAERDDNDGSSRFNAAHGEHAIARAGIGEALGPGLGGDRDRRDYRNGNGGTDPHDEGRDGAGPEQSLRERKHQHQNRAGAWTQAYGNDG